MPFILGFLTNDRKHLPCHIENDAKSLSNKIFPIEMPIDFFAEINKLILNSYGNTSEPEQPKQLEKEEQSWKIHIS